jgi:thymidylate synthase
MKAYHDLCRNTLRHGTLRPNRTGTPAMGIFGTEFVHDLQTGFPLLTTKQMDIRKVEAELVWFIEGGTNAARLRELGTKIWDDNANGTEGWLANPHRKGTDDCGPIYGAQWRKYEHIEIVKGEYLQPCPLLHAFLDDGYRIMTSYTDTDDNHCYVVRKEIDQLQNLIDGIKADPYGRRHIVSSWNVGKLDKVALPACHAMFQCYVREDKKGVRYLDLKMTQRSADSLLGIPFNIASYAMLTHLLAMLTDLKPGILTLSFGDLHIYENHLAQIWTQLSRTPMALPELTVRRVNSLDEVTTGMFQLHGYESHPPLPGKMAK